MKNLSAQSQKPDIDRTVLKELYKTHPPKHAAAILLNWVIIVATAYFAIQFLNPATYLLAIVIIGARMHALAILMHDASHFRFLSNKKWNDIITNVTSMYPIFTSVEAYRQNHLRHHQHLNTEEDPDWFAKLGKKEFTFPSTREDFFLTILSYFTLYRGVKDALWLLKRLKAPTTNGKKLATPKENTPVKIGFYVVLAIALTALGGWLYFLLFWIIPYFSTFFMFQYIRSVGEHFGDLEHDHLLTSTRTIVKVTPIEKFFFAPHNVGYHLEHHLYPGVPFYNLPALHKALMANPEYAEKAHITHGLMGGLLKELV